jgi:hypothetical protein
MEPVDLRPSARLIRAAAARAAARAEVTEREDLLDRLAPVPSAPDAQRDAANPAGRRGAAPSVAAATAAGNGATATAGAGDEGAGNPPRQVLRGPAIRTTAVAVAIERGSVEALHYRDWFDLLTEAGYQVAGKDPLAVFLSQLSRSPLVRRSTQAGVYEIDRRAPGRLRRELDELHRELRNLTTGAPATPDLQAVRAKRKELTAAINRTERALEEAEAGLGEHPARRVAN